MATLEQVFGVRKESILSYLVREHVDNYFIDAMKTDRQIIVYGSSKQGKTSLVEKYVPYKENILVSYSPKTQITDIYKSILRQLDIEIISDSESKLSVGSDVGAAAKFKAIIPFFGSGGVEGSSKVKGNYDDTQKSKSIEFNLDLPQDISELIKTVKSEKFVILENFHYLDDEIQKTFSFDLRTFQELGIRFIILGVWREKNRLAQFNGDLLDRVIEIPVEPWSEDEFRQVIQKGENELNIKFSNELIEGVIRNAFDSIGVVQELLKTICQLAEVRETVNQKKEINDTSLLDRAMKIKAADYAARHMRALEDIAKGQKTTKTKDGQLPPLFLPYYMVRSILTIDFNDIVKGIKRETLEAEIKKYHHRSADVRPGDMSNLLYNLSKMQSDKGISPPIFDFDRVNRELKIIDSTFYFFLRNIDRNQILTSLVSPIEEK